MSEEKEKMLFLQATLGECIGAHFAIPECTTMCFGLCGLGWHGMGSGCLNIYALQTPFSRLI
jgi:hypothetical protein